jgi:hypothetical protein
MKKRVTSAVFVALVCIPLLLNAQEKIALDSLIARKTQTFDVSGNKFTLVLTGVGRNDSILVALAGNNANPNHGSPAGKTISYELDDLVSLIPSGGKSEFVILKGKAHKEIARFSVNRSNVNSINGGKQPSNANASAHIDKDPAIAFYDAQFLYAAFIKSSSLPLEVLSKYNFPKGSDWKIMVRDNPFIQEFLKLNALVLKDSAAADKAIAHSAAGGALASLAGIDVTKYVQGAADFLRDRIKEELSIAFIERFRATIESIPELRALLPKSYNVFNTSDPFKVSSLGQTYKTAFQEDLENLITNFEMFIDTTKIKRYEALRTNQVFIAFRASYHVIDMSANNFHPIDIFEYLDAKFGLDASASRVADINKYISLLNLLSLHLRKKYDQQLDIDGWIALPELKAFDPNAILLFWGLVYQQKPDVFNGIKIQHAGVPTSLTALLLTGYNAAQLYITQFVVLASNIDKRIKEFKGMAEKLNSDVAAIKELAINDFVANADKITAITDFIFNFPYFKDEIGGAFYQSDYYIKWRPVIIDAIETTKGIYIKDFAKISVNATSLITDFSRVLQVEGTDEIFSPNFIENFVFYSNFIVDVINADSAKEVKAVLDRYAEPVGSFRVKRQSRFSVSVNAYPGLYIGSEKYKDANKNDIKNTTFGVTAPIGFSINVGNFPGKKWSTSLFLNAVDIAAALSYRWTNDTLDLPQTVTLGQIFAPGAFLVVGFPNLPISAMAGIQHVPELRSITQNGNTIDEIAVTRFTFSIVVDVPFFNFYSKQKKYKAKKQK